MKVILKKGPLFEQAEAKAYKYLSGILVQRMNEHQEKLAQKIKRNQPKSFINSMVFQLQF